MDTDSIIHEGYRITAEPRQAEGGGMWSAVLTISRGDGEDRESWLLSAGDEYGSRKEALQRCFDFAREVIDREMKGCSLD